MSSDRKNIYIFNVLIRIYLYAFSRLTSFIAFKNPKIK